MAAPASFPRLSLIFAPSLHPSPRPSHTHTHTHTHTSVCTHRCTVLTLALDSSQTQSLPVSEGTMLFHHSFCPNTLLFYFHLAFPFASPFRFQKELPLEAFPDLQVWAKCPSSPRVLCSSPGGALATSAPWTLAGLKTMCQHLVGNC